MVAPVPPTPTAAAGTEQCPADAMVFSPKLPPPPRRLPYRATECTQPPPGGPEQFQAVEAARRHDCRSSLMSVQAGMKKSVDHCRLYQTAWLCFDEYHQRSLEGTKSKTWDDARFEVYHFEGTEDVQNAVWTEDDKRLPYWFRPPVDGLEFRLKMWNDDPQMAHYVNDLFGEPKVADDFAKDLQLEATLAAGLACVPEDQRTPQMIDAWARRVYFVADALQQDRTGRLLNQHRTDLIPVLKDLLAKATTDMTLADGTTVPIPEPVRDAYDTAMGTKPPPTSKPVVVPRPVDPTSLEPTIQDDGPGVTVNRRGR